MTTRIIIQSKKCQQNLLESGKIDFVKPVYKDTSEVVHSFSFDEGN